MSNPSARVRRPGSTRRRTTRLGLTALGVVAGLVFLLPLWWALVNSLRPGSDTFRYISPLSWRTFLPLDATIENYVALASTDLGRGIVNSLLISGATVLVGLIICAMAAFALSAVPFRGQGAVFSIVILSFLIPFDTVAIPLADMFRDWNLQNTFIGLILPGLGNGMAIFLLRTFFLAVPRELVEAGRLDGLGWWGTFRSIYLPLARPALIGAGLILFLFQWQAYVWPLLMGTDSAHIVGPVALANMQGQFNVDYGLMFAGSMVLILIPLAIIVGFQRYFVQSVTSSGLK